MIENEPTMIILLIMLPLLALYVLLALRIFERRKQRDEDQYKTKLQKPIIDIRDAALITIGLDFAEFSRLVPRINEISEIKHELALVLILVVVHLIALFSSALSRPSVSIEDSYIKSLAFNKLMQLYLAAILLTTNAVTINKLLGLL